VDYDSDLILPVEKLLDAITENTKLVAIANPNSPTGTIIDEVDILRILDRAKEVGSVVIVDEAYYYFYSGTIVDYIDAYENLVVTRTFSKAFGLASIRLGFLIAHPATIELLAKFKPMYEVNSFAVMFGCELLDRMDIVEKSVHKSLDGKKYLLNEMDILGYYVHPTYANFVLINVGEEHAESISKYMFENGIIIKGGFSHSSLKQYIRISLGDVSQMEQVVECLKSYMEGH
jgi:histidinol-phosphate aminotransferase